MDSHSTRIWLLAWALLFGLGTAAWADIPRCEESAESLWRFRTEVAAWTEHGGITPIDGSTITQLPGQCLVGTGQPVSVHQLREWLLPWATNRSSMDAREGVKTLWLLDLFLMDQVAGGLQLAPESLEGLNAAIAERRRQFDTAGALPFPLSQTESVPLGEVIAALPVYRPRIQQKWRSLDSAQQATVSSGIAELRRGLIDLKQKEEMLYLGPLLWESVFDSDELPPPAGESNVSLYLDFLELTATYVAKLQHLETLQSAVADATTITPVAVDPATLEALRAETNASRFREPLQIPPIAVSDNSWLLNWLNGLMQRFAVNRPLGEGLRWLGILLSAALLGWIAYLLVGGSDPWGNRVFRFRSSNAEDIVARGRNLSPEAQFKLALEAARAGRQLEAWHWLTQGFILGLAQGELVKLDWSRTNREVLRELQHKRVACLEPAATFFRTAEGVVYGGRTTSVTEIEQFERSLSSTLASLPKKSK